MGASVFAYWPGITKRQLKAQPGFGNDCKAWGDFMANLANSPKALRQIEQMGFDAVTTFKTEGLDDVDVDWVTPRALATAALALRDLVRRLDPSVRLLLKIYAKSANDIDPIHEELARDLDDIGAVASWAQKVGAKKMTFDINW